MEIDKQTMKALSSESRVSILKSLIQRRKMPAELQRELGFSGSTIIGHLEILERSGLVKRIETGHKWTYYELTDKGFGLIKPRFPMQFVLILSVGVLVIFGGFLKYLTSAFTPQFAAASETALKAVGTAQEIAPAIDWIMIIAMLAGLIMSVIGLAGLLRGRATWLR